MQSENECGFGDNSWEYAFYVWTMLKHYISNGAESYMYWNMVLEPEGRSSWGDPQNALVTVLPELSLIHISLLILRNREHEHICDGYIVTGLLRNEIFDFERYAAERSRPVVLFGHTELPGVSCIDVDNVEGGRMGTRQLTELCLLYTSRCV